MSGLAILVAVAGILLGTILGISLVVFALARFAMRVSNYLE